MKEETKQKVLITIGILFVALFFGRMNATPFGDLCMNIGGIGMVSTVLTGIWVLKQ